MKRTRVNENIYYFTDDSIMKDLSNSSVIFTEMGPVVIDTFGSLKQWEYVRDFINEKGYQEPIAVIFTHGHFDHSLGTQNPSPCYPIYAHENAIEAITRDRDERLPRIIEGGYLPADTEVIFPTVTFTDEMKIRAGSFCFKLIFTPGHSMDSITIYEETNKILFAGDNIAEIDGKVAMPYFNFEQGIDERSNDSLNMIYKLKKLGAKYMIQGHGADVDPKGYFDTIDKYAELILNFARESVMRGIDEEVKNASPSEIMGSRLLDRIYDIDGEYITFKDNLSSACAFYKKSGK